MSTKSDNALAVTQAETTELAVSAQQAMARHEIEGAIVVARRFPRNEDAAFGRVIQSCARPSFAAMTRYSYPRGGEQVIGASINLAREIARCWGNIRYGADIIHDDEETRTVRAWAWDVESNVKESQDASFRKLVYRKKGGWQKPDERDLLELTNRIAAKAVRNCILHLVPPDLVEDALAESQRTLAADVGKNPEEARKKMIRAFGTVGVSVEHLEAYLGHPLKQASPEEVADLRGIWKSIADGNSTWAEYTPTQPASQPAAGGATLDDLTKPQTSAPDAQSPPDADAEAAAQRRAYLDGIKRAKTAGDLDALADSLQADGLLTAEAVAEIEGAVAAARKRLENRRG